MVDTPTNNGPAIEALLRAQLAVVGRSVVSPRELLDIIAPTNRGADKNLKAYNLCDGTRIQSAVAKESKLDSGNFNRTVARWIEAGVLFEVPVGDGVHLRHLYPVPLQELVRRSKENK